MPTLAVTTVPAFDDNYLWLVHAPADPRQVLVVDPGDAAAVEAALRAQGLVLAGILVGVVVSMTSLFAPEMAKVAIFALMALVLLWRPEGLFKRLRL
jgi:hypothetical protein